MLKLLGNRSNVYDFEGKKLSDITWDIIDESKLIFVEPFDRYTHSINNPLA